MNRATHTTDLHFFEPRQTFCIGIDQEIKDGMQVQFDLEKKRYIWQRVEKKKSVWWHICDDTQANIEKFIQFCNKKKEYKDQQILIDWWEKFKKSNYYQRIEITNLQSRNKELMDLI